MIKMDIKQKLKDWNERLVPSGDYSRLELENVCDCYGLAKHLRDNWAQKVGEILVFGERYLAPFPSRDGEKNLRISWNEKIIYNLDRIFNRELNPIPLRSSQVQWGAHFVYVEDETVFDPILGEPCPLRDFSKRIFGEEIPHEKILW